MSNDILLITLNILIFIKDIFWKYIDDKIEHFDQTSVTSGPDYGCACLIDLSELYLNSKKSFGVTRKTFSWQNQINQHHKYDRIEKITLSSKWKQNEFHPPDRDHADHLLLEYVHHKIANLSTFWASG